MKAAVFHAPGDMRIETVPTPTIGDDDVLLKIHACAICGTDQRIFRHGHKAVKPPHILGHEIAATVSAVGKNVTDCRVGDKVCLDPIVACGTCSCCKRGLTNLCLVFKQTTEAFGYFYPGGFAEYMAVPGRAVRRGTLLRVPAGLSLDQAAIAEPMACALNGMTTSQMSVGESIVIIGTGPIGCMHISLARNLGAARIIVAEIQPDRLEMARRFGADRYVNPQTEDLTAAVMQETDGLGASVVMVAVSNRMAQQNAVALAAPRGRVNFFGGLPKDDFQVTVDSNAVHYKELYLHGTSGTTGAKIETCMALMAAGRMPGREFITRTLALDELPGYLAAGQFGNDLKVIVKP
ncbi:MAG: alcohol dehydrogenase catalytic domain-containing protein [Phycisphaerae bacterium]|nr:alcohol dehydrogenase catalytic domain-containing protein [Phycisphaerae bacterium]